MKLNSFPCIVVPNLGYFTKFYLSPGVFFVFLAVKEAKDTMNSPVFKTLNQTQKFIISDNVNCNGLFEVDRKIYGS